MTAAAINNCYWQQLSATAIDNGTMAMAWGQQQVWQWRKDDNGARTALLQGRLSTTAFDNVYWWRLLTIAIDDGYWQLRKDKS
jgi:hypothetical protein